MQAALDTLISTLGGVVGNLSPAGKAIAGALVPVLIAAVNMALAGSLNTTSLILLGTGAVTSLAVYFVPNLERKAKPAPTPAPAPAPQPPAPPAK